MAPNSPDDNWIPTPAPATIAEAIEQAYNAAEDQASIYALHPRIALLPVATEIAYKQRTAATYGKAFSSADWSRSIKSHRKVGPRAVEPEDRPTSSLPYIKTNNRPLRDISEDSLAALRAANDPPTLFVRASQMAYVARDERGRPALAEVVTRNKAHLRGKLDRAANYYRQNEESDSIVFCPTEVVEDILALSSEVWGLPPVEIIVEVPTLRPDGTILDAPGYDASSKTLYLPPAGFHMDPIPDDINADDLDAAFALLDEAIGEFPYADEASKTNALGLLLTAIARPAIPGCVPLALIDAPQAGTGKSLLADVMSTVWTGREAPMQPFPRNEEDIQKSITATLLQGRTLVCFDNVEGRLSSPALALVLTARVYESRILGVSNTVVAPNLAVWLATGNNITPGGDLPRRCYHIRLDAKSSRPYQDRKFSKPDILAWTREHRPALIRALLMISVHWFRRGCPCTVDNPLGKFEGWHRTIGSILHTAGRPEFLGNLSASLDVDDVTLQWEGLLAELHDAYDGNSFAAEDIAHRNRAYYLTPPGGRASLSPPFTLPDSLADVDIRKEAALKGALQRSFAKRAEQRFGHRQLRLEREYVKRTWYWCVREG